MSTSPDVVVVGGGLVGAACAYELARDGHRVTVVDRHDVRRATDAGVLSPETMGGLPSVFLDLAGLAATGHGAKGLLLGPFSGRLVADALDLAPFSPARLAPI